MDEEVDATQLSETFEPVVDAQGAPLSLTRVTARGIGWTWGGVAASMLIQLGYTAVMSRQVEPAAFGLVAAALVGLRFVSYLANLGLGSAVVQRRFLDDDDASGALLLAVGVGAVVVVLAVASSPLLATIVDQPDAAPVMRWLAIGLFAAAVATVPDGVLRRHLRFGAVTVCQVGSFAIGYLGVGIPLAYRGWGVWSLVTATVVQSTLMLGGLLAASGIRWRWHVDRRLARDLLSFGGTVTVTGFAEFLTGSMDTLAVGRWIGATGLGQYSRGTYLVALPVERLNTASSRVLLPALSRVQDDRTRFGRALERGVMLMSVVVTLPVAAAACSAPALVPLILGPGWEQAAAVLPIVGVAHGLSMLTHLPAVAAEAKGRVRAKLAIQLVALATMSMLVALVVAVGPSLTRFAWCWLATEAFRFVLYWVILHGALEIEIAAVAKRYATTALLATTFATPALVVVRLLDHTGFFALVVSVALGALITVGLVLTPLCRLLRAETRSTWVSARSSGP